MVLRPSPDIPGSKLMIDSASRNDIETLVRRTLCSTFVTVDGTITLRREMAVNAAKAVVSCLQSNNLLARSVDFFTVERLIFAAVRSGKTSVPTSVPASVVARHICAAICDQQIAA